MEKMALEKSLGLPEWGVFHYVPQLHNMANEILLKGLLPSYRRKKKLALWVSEAPTHPASTPHHPTNPLLISPMSQQKTLCTVSRGRLKEKGGTFTCSSPLFTLEHKVRVCIRVCRCVCAVTCNIMHISSSFPSVSISVFSLLDTHTCTDTPIDCWGTGWSCSPRLRGLALACLLPFPFCSSARSPFPSMYWRWVEAYHGQGSPHHHKTGKKKHFLIRLWI